jgi:hypothetical protein
MYAIIKYVEGNICVALEGKHFIFLKRRKGIELSEINTGPAAPRDLYQRSGQERCTGGELPAWQAGRVWPGLRQFVSRLPWPRLLLHLRVWPGGALQQKVPVAVSAYVCLHEDAVIGLCLKLNSFMHFYFYTGNGYEDQITEYLFRYFQP